MKKLICLLCICLLLVGMIPVTLAEAPQLLNSGPEDPYLPGSSPIGGDGDGGVGGGGGWPV
jgi:hypothetical protein